MDDARAELECIVLTPTIVNDKMHDLRMQHPFSCIISGSSGSGKSTWVYKLLEHQKELIYPAIDTVVYFYTEYQKYLFESMRQLHLVHQFIQGTPSIEQIRDLTSQDSNVLIVVDDNMQNVNSDLSEIFTTFRHRNASVLFLTQNLFLSNKDYRTMSLNANYIVIMKNPRDSSQIINFAKQFSPYSTRFVVDAFQNATANRAHSYLMFDLRQDTEEDLRVRTRIFPDEMPMSVYIKSAASVT